MTLGVNPRARLEPKPWATDFRQLDHLDRARAIRQPADEAALLERGDQPVNAGFRAQVERILHFVERRWNPGLLEALVDETQEFSLLACEHWRFP